MALVHEFQDIVDFWRELYHVDGFHLDTPQALNKNLSSGSGIMPKKQYLRTYTNG